MPLLASRHVNGKPDVLIYGTPKLTHRSGTIQLALTDLHDRQCYGVSCSVCPLHHTDEVPDCSNITLKQITLMFPQLQLEHPEYFI